MYLDWGCANVKERARCLHLLFDNVGSKSAMSPAQSRRKRMRLDVRKLHEFTFNSHHSCAPTPGRAG